MAYLISLILNMPAIVLIFHNNFFIILYIIHLNMVVNINLSRTLISGSFILGLTITQKEVIKWNLSVKRAYDNLQICGWILWLFRFSGLLRAAPSGSVSNSKQLPPPTARFLSIAPAVQESNRFKSSNDYGAAIASRSSFAY